MTVAAGILVGVIVALLIERFVTASQHAKQIEDLHEAVLVANRQVVTVSMARSGAEFNYAESVGKAVRDEVNERRDAMQRPAAEGLG